MQNAIRLVAVLATVGMMNVAPAGAAQSNPPAKPPAGAQPAAKPATPQTVRPLAKDAKRIESKTGFIVDYPKKDWQEIRLGTGSAQLVLFHKNKTVTVAIERTSVPNALSRKEITEQTAKLEFEHWADRRPLTAFGHQVADLSGEPAIVIDFTQPGPQGTERVRVYAIPRGRDRFRVICTAPEATYKQYWDTCHQIALSLTPTAQ